MKFYEPVFVSKTESDRYRILPAGIVLSENSDVRNIVPSFEAGCFSVMADCLAPYPQAQEDSALFGQPTSDVSRRVGTQRVVGKTPH